MLHFPKAERGFVCRTPNTFFRYHGWPSVAKDDDGVLYAVDSAFRISHVCPFGKTALYKSYDGGRTWSIPSVINDTYLDDRDAGILSLGGKKLLVTWFSHPAKVYLEQYGEHLRKVWPGSAGVLEAYPDIPEEEGRGGSFVRISEDGGNTWGETVRIPVSAPHGPNRLRDGRLIYLGKALYTDALPAGAVAAYESWDEGKTWDLLSILDFPAGTKPDNFHEPHVAELPGGRLIGMIRAQGPEVAHGFTMYETHSDDGGRTWSPMVSLGVSGSPPHLLLHSSGAVICSFGRREEPFGERALVSYDNGATWPEEYVLCETAPCDLGYPATVELDDGSLLTVYYQQAEGDPFTSLQWTKWRLD